MRQYKFKTNIKCGGCVAQVQPHLEANKNISKWEVDTTSPDKLLVVETEELNADEVRMLVEQTGFKAEHLCQY